MAVIMAVIYYFYGIWYECKCRMVAALQIIKGLKETQNGIGNLYRVYIFVRACLDK